LSLIDTPCEVPSRRCSGRRSSVWGRRSPRSSRARHGAAAMGLVVVTSLLLALAVPVGSCGLGE
jgi:hypothetical protein